MDNHKYYTIYQAEIPNWLNNTNDKYLGEIKVFLNDDNNLYGWIFEKLESNNHASYYAMIGNKKVKLNQKYAKKAMAEIKPLPIIDNLYPIDILSRTHPLPNTLINVLSDSIDFNLYSSVRADVYIDLSDDGDIINIDWSDDNVLLPRAADRTSNVLPTLAWDNMDYALPSYNKKHQAWADLLLNSKIVGLGKSEGFELSNRIDRTCPIINSMVRFLEKNPTIEPNLVMDKRPKNKNLINNPKICYRHHPTQTLIAHADSIKAMASEMFGDTHDMTTQTPVIMLNRNPVRLFSRPPESAISYGIVPTLTKEQAYTAHDRFKRIVNSDGFFNIGDVGLALVADDDNYGLLASIFKRLFSSEYATRQDTLNVMTAFDEFVPNRHKFYRFFAVDLKSQGTVKTLLAINIDEKSLCESLLRAINTTTPPNAHLVGYWFFDESYSNNKGLLQELIKFTLGLADGVPRQFIASCKYKMKNKALSSFDFYTLKHFLLKTNAYDYKKGIVI